MTKEDLSQDSEDVKSTQDTGSESEEASDDQKSSDDSQDDSQDEIKSLKETVARLEKGVAKFFSEKGRENKEAKEEQRTTTPANDEVIEEVALANHPELEHVLDQAKDIAQKTGRSLLKVIKEESWLMEKAKSLAEAQKAKSKVQSPSNQIEGEIDFKTIKPEHISKLSDKDYKRYQEYMRKQSVTPGKIML